MRRVLLAALVVTSACGGGKETSPSPAPGASTFSLSGRVSRLDNASAVVAGARVAILDGPNAGQSTTTDGSGRYAFAALQQAGFTIEVSAENYITQTRPVTLTSNQTVDVGLQPQPAAITLIGQVLDAVTGAPIAGAIVRINGRYQGTTDGSGRYTVTGLLDYGIDHDFTYVSADGYVADYRYIRGTTQNVRLRRIERIAAGESKLVTVAPDDSLCVNNVEDTPGLGPDHVCRSVSVLAPNAGAVTIEAVSTQTGEHPRLEVELLSGTPCCSERIGNPTTIQVSAGAVIVVHVEMPASSISSQSFVLSSSPAVP